MNSQRRSNWRMMIALLAGLLTPVVANDYSVNWHSIDAGGGAVSGGAYSAQTVIGQPDAGTLTGGDYELLGGFLPVAAITVAAGDCNGNGAIELGDFAQLQDACLTGPDGGLPGGCICADLDVDSDVDLRDIREFQIRFEG